MNFLGVGPAELIVILVVALIFVGPERLPKLAADIARTIREIRKYTGSIAAEFNDVIQEFEKDTAEDRSKWKEIGQGLTDASRSLTEAMKQAHADAATAGATAPPAAITAPEAAAMAEANGTPSPPATDAPASLPVTGEPPSPVPAANGAAPTPAEPAHGPR
ncbi:MAG: twin-arginine translocase TatA/TatE family subunit [Chloroflexota bacterium]|nr:twin-arginine translocase TatA/TatE family subunit [Chloroflexota bacterium]